MIAAIAAALALAAAVPEVRLISIAPSPYTQRHDAMRAGAGILLSLQRLIQEHRLPLRATFYDGAPAIGDAARSRALVRGARVLVIGGSTWAQGSSWYLRRFFEQVDLESLAGVSATAWPPQAGHRQAGRWSWRTRCAR